MKYKNAKKAVSMLLLSATILVTAVVPASACPSKKGRSKTAAPETETTAAASNIPNTASKTLSADMTETDETDISESVTEDTDLSETDTEAASHYSGFSFETVDINGEPFTIDDIRSSKLVILNFWEPWCGPCVGELPDLQKLYENYQDDGLLILGAYSTLEMSDDVRGIVEDVGITYPILQVNETLDGFDTGYVPTTVVLTGEGYFLTETPIINALPYEKWEELVNICLDVLP